MSLLNFFKIKLDSEEFKFLTNKLTTLILELDTLRSKVKQLETDNETLRGQFNRKLKGIAEKELKETKDINTSEPIKYL